MRCSRLDPPQQRQAGPGSLWHLRACQIKHTLFYEKHVKRARQEGLELTIRVDHLGCRIDSVHLHKTTAGHGRGHIGQRDLLDDGGFGKTRARRDGPRVLGKEDFVRVSHPTSES